MENYSSEQKCTLCKKVIDDLLIEVTLNISASRKDSNNRYELIGNSQQSSVEFMCKDCFDSFTTKLEESLHSEE